MAGGNFPYDGGRYGRAHCARGGLPRHRHPFGYICIVVRGRFVEAGDAGRFRVAAGDILVHRPFEAHLDLFDASGADVLNLPLPARAADAPRYAVADLDQVVRLAERDPREAAEGAAEAWQVREGEEDWPDLLARDIRSDTALSIGGWAERHGLAAATVSRGFAAAYGAPPARYRAEVRARRAWEAVASGAQPLAALAQDSGFADQAHMTRAVVQLTGAPPRRWRPQVKSVQDRPAVVA